MRILSLLLLILGLTGPANAENWTEFRGPDGQGHANAANLPSEWSATKNVSWKTPLKGLAWSSPVIWGNRIFVTDAVTTDDQMSLRTLCLDADSGKIIWDKEIFNRPTTGPISQMHKKNSHASPTPVLEADRIYVHYGPNGTACLDFDGNVLWKTSKLKYQPQHGNGGCPAVAGDLLIICCDGRDIQYVVGLEKTTGEIRWKTMRDTEPGKGFSFCTPLVINVNGQQQAICPGSCKVFAYEPATGKTIWSVDYGQGYSVVPRPVYGNGFIYVCSGFNKASLFAIDPTGKGDVTETHVKWKRDRGIPKSPSILLVEDELYFVDDGGIATSVNAITGEQIWMQRLGGKFSASPLLADGKIYFQSEGGESIVIRPGKTYDEIARNRLWPKNDPTRTFASLSVADSALFLRSEKALYRIEK